MSFPSDLEIARSVTPRPILDVAHELGFTDDEIELYGSHKAKITIEGIERKEREHGRGKYVLVTAISPTPLGEGKSTTTVGLAQGLERIGKKAAVALRQPSLGPVFGIKGGAAGGGYSQVIPMEDFNLHLTGDVHAIGAAHNLAAAFIDNHIHHGNALGIDANNVLWPRVMDISDRALREVVVGLGGKDNGYPRETQFVITVASEVMAILALATDLKTSGRGSAGSSSPPAGTAPRSPPRTSRSPASMAVLLKDALKPNLLQTLEGGPAFVHCGPFANIAHGNNSILADRAALAAADIVVTEAGFGADMGAEKFFDIKCRASGLRAAMPRSSWPPSARSRCTAAWAGSWPASRSTRRCSRTTPRASGGAGPTWPSRSRTSARSASRSWSRSTCSRPTPPTRSRRSARSRSPREPATPWSPATSPTAAPGPRTSPARSGPRRRRGAPTSSSSTPTTCPSRPRSRPSRPRSTAPTAWTTPRPPTRASRPTRPWATATCPICMAKTQYSLCHDADAQGPADRVPDPGPRGPPVRRRRLRHPDLRRHAHDAGPQHASPGGESIDIDADGNVVGLF